MPTNRPVVLGTPSEFRHIRTSLLSAYYELSHSIGLYVKIQRIFNQRYIWKMEHPGAHVLRFWYPFKFSLIRQTLNRIVIPLRLGDRNIYYRAAKRKIQNIVIQLINLIRCWRTLKPTQNGYSFVDKFSASEASNSFARSNDVRSSKHKQLALARRKLSKRKKRRINKEKKIAGWKNAEINSIFSREEITQTNLRTLANFQSAERINSHH